MTKRKSNAGRKKITDPLERMQTRYISVRAKTWVNIDQIAAQMSTGELTVDYRDLLRAMIAMIEDKVAQNGGLAL